MKKIFNSFLFFQILVISLVFWLLDFTFHYEGVGESNFYYISKFGNAIIFAVMWVFAFRYKENWKKFLFSFIFGTWVSLYYLLASYSGFVQFIGIDARYTPPPFVIFGFYLHPILWWFFHITVFYLGILIAEYFNKSR